MAKNKRKKRKRILSVLLGVFVIGIIAGVFVLSSARTAKPAQAQITSALTAILAQAIADDIVGEDEGAGSDKKKDKGVIEELFDSIASNYMTAITVLLVTILDKSIQFLGWLLTFFVVVLEMVASYDGFRSNEQVITGWKIIRDVVNSFFIVVLIAIALSTIIRVQKFHFKQTLPKLIIAAFLVNFSRTICLLAISFSTAVMNTFVKAIGDAWPALVTGLRAPSTIKFFSGATASETAVELIGTIASQYVAIIVLFLASSVILFFVVILLYRILMLWMLMILSPLAFFFMGRSGARQHLLG